MSTPVGKTFCLQTHLQFNFNFSFHTSLSLDFATLARMILHTSGFHNTVMASGPPLPNDSADSFSNVTVTNGTDWPETLWEWPRTIPSYIVTGLFVWAAIVITSHQVSGFGVWWNLKQFGYLTRRHSICAVRHMLFSRRIVTLIL